MAQIVKNELIKMYYSKKILLCCMFLSVITILTIILFVGARGESGVKKSERYISSLENKKEATESVSEKNKIEAEINSIQQSIQQYNELKSNSNNWKISLEKSTSQLKNQNTDNLSDIEKEQLNETIKLNEYLIKNNIQPTNGLSKNQLSFLSDYFNILNMLIFIIVVFMTSDSVSNEYSLKTIRFLLTRPVSKFNLILGKFLAGVLSITGIITAFNALVYFASGIAFGFSSPKFPISIGPKFVSSNMLDITLHKFIAIISDSSTIITFYNFLFQYWILEIVFIVVSASFCIFISSLLKNNIISVVTPLMLYFLNIFIVSKSSLLDNIKPVVSSFFMNFYNSIDIINRSFIQNTGAVYINTFSSIIIMILWSILFLFLSKLSTLKKDIEL